jgi:hypothetical protein
VLEGKGRKVIGIDASGKPEATKDQVARIARDTVARLDPEAVVPDEAIVLDERFHAGIYGIPDEETIAAMKRECGVRAVEVVGIGQHEWYTTTSTSLTPPVAAQTDALITDPVYEVSPTTPRFQAKSHRTESHRLQILPCCMSNPRGTASGLRSAIWVTKRRPADAPSQGKSMAGMIQLVKEGSIKPGSNVLYLHLGGQPALNAYSSYFPVNK